MWSGGVAGGGGGGGGESLSFRFRACGGYVLHLEFSGQSCRGTPCSSWHAELERGAENYVL